MLSMKQMWGFVFEEFPTYEELVSGTPKLSLVFELARDSKRTKNQLAGNAEGNSNLLPFRAKAVTDWCFEVSA